MFYYPNNLEHKLGFDLLRKRLNDYTRSRMGQEALEALQPSASVPLVRRQLAMTGDIQAILQFDDELPLSPMPDVRDVMRAIMPEGAFMPPEALLGVAHILNNARRIRQYLDARREKYPALQEIAFHLTPLKTIEDRIRQVVDEQGQVKDDASYELRRIRRALVRLHAELRQRVSDELRKAHAAGWAAEDQPTIRNGRMVIPVKAEAKRKISGFLHDLSATGQTVYIEPASVLELNNDIRTLENEEMREIENILREVCIPLRENAAIIIKNTEMLGEFDLVYAKARLANELGASVPSLNDQGLFKLKGVRNPVLILRNARNRTSVVPLNLTLGEDFRTLVITGPNAGGKSVAMKTVGLIALMLAYGMPIPCTGSSTDCCLFSRIFADIGDEQSIENDLSTFSSHLTHLRNMLAEADHRTLALIDEAGTGTDPTEGAALAQALLSALHKAGAYTIVTTHHGALKVFAHDTEGVENGAMLFDQENLTPTYRFQAGTPGSSYAFEMASRLQLPESIIEQARELAGEQNTRFEHLIQTFNERNLALETALQKAQSENDALRESRLKYDELRAHLQRVKDQVREDALREAQKVLDGANAQVERTVREIREAQAEAERTKAAREALEATRETIRKYQESLAKRRQAEARQTPTTPTLQKPAKSADKPISTTISVGDQVVMQNGNATAEVLEISGKNALIVQGSMKIKVKLDQLKKVAGPLKQKVSIRHTSVSAPMLANRAKIHLDVRGFRVDDAKIAVTQFLDDAVATGLERVEILHGTGTGALRLSIREMLTHYPEVSRVEEAPWDLGGPGVTYVWLK